MKSLTEIIRNAPSLDELRSQEERWKERKKEKQKQIDEKAKAYFANLRKQIQADDEKRKLQEIKSRNPYEPIPLPAPACTYSEAKVIFWSKYVQVCVKRGLKKEDIEISEQMKVIMPELIKYISGNDGALDRRKGLYVSGATGVGKTVIMEALRNTAYSLRYDSMRFKIANVPEIYANAIASKEVNLNYLMSENRCFEEVGFDPNETNVINKYGNKINIMNDILRRRYIKFDDSGQKTHIITNLPYYEINDEKRRLMRSQGVSFLHDRLDERINSRMKQMFNFITITGRDLRSKK